VDVFFSTGNFYFFLEFGEECDYIKDKFEDYKKELNKVLPQYEKNMIDEELELKVPSFFYYLSKCANKQTLNFRNKEVISLFNNYASKIKADQELYSFEYD
jgi:hypothetical protein